MMPWQTVIPGLASPFDAPVGPGSWPDHIVFVVLFCALVDFIKHCCIKIAKAHFF